MIWESLNNQANEAKSVIKNPCMDHLDTHFICGLRPRFLPLFVPLLPAPLPLCYVAAASGASGASNIVAAVAIAVVAIGLSLS